MISSVVSAEVADLSVAVLAAGSSHRFGGEDKLAAPFRGCMLGLHICRTLAVLPATNRWVITSRQSHACRHGWEDTGFTVLVNPDASAGMGTSLAMAAKLAKASNTGRLMICLADMPLVPRNHLEALTARSQKCGPSAILASGIIGKPAKKPMPPAIFGANLFDQLARSSGDKGARDLLRAATLVLAQPCAMIDVDTPQDLLALENRYRKSRSQGD